MDFDQVRLTRKLSAELERTAHLEGWVLPDGSGARRSSTLFNA